MEFDFFDAMGPVRAPLDWCSKATPSTTIGLTRRERGRTATKKTQGQGPRHRHNPNQPNPGHNLTQARAKSEFGRLFKIKKKETEPNHGLDCHVSNNGQPCQPMACQEAGPRHGEPTTNRWSANSKTREPWHTMSGPRHCVPWIWLP